MINIAIFDDENIFCSQIEKFLYKVCGKEIPFKIDVYYSGRGLEEKIRGGKIYDLIYLDIQMKNGDGITAAKSIREVDENVLLVFVSGNDRYLRELFSIDVLEFLKKPINEKLFVNTFLKANKKICDNKFYFCYQYKNAEYKILCNEILYFESDARKIIIHKRDGESVTFNGKLSEVETKLAEGKISFLRIHQSYLVNYNWISVRLKTEVRMIDGTVLSVSEDRQKKFSKIDNITRVCEEKSVKADLL